MRSILLIFILCASNMSIAKTDKPNAARLSCYQKLSHSFLETATKSTYKSFYQPATVGKDYAKKLFTAVPDDQYLVLPSTHAGEHGAYLITDYSATWIALPAAENKTSQLMDKDIFCFQFSDSEKVGGTIHMTYVNNDLWTNPGDVFEGKSNAHCEDKKFTDLKDDELEKAFKDDLVSKINSSERIIQTTYELIKKIKAKDEKDPEIVKLEMELQNTLSALNSCAEGLIKQKNKDKEIFSAIASAKIALGIEGKLAAPPSKKAEK